MLEYILLFLIITIPIIFNYFIMRYIDEYMEPYYINICIWIYPIFVFIIGALLWNLLRLSDGFLMAVLDSFPCVGLIICLGFLGRINKINSTIYIIIIGIVIAFSRFVSACFLLLDMFLVAFFKHDSVFLGQVVFVYVVLIFSGVVQGIVLFYENKNP